MIMINLTQTLASLCSGSYLAIDMPIIFDFIFTCFLSSLSLTLIYLVGPAGR